MAIIMSIVFIIASIFIIQLIYNSIEVFNIKKSIKETYGHHPPKTRTEQREKLLAFWENEVAHCMFGDDLLSKEEIRKIANKEWARIAYTLSHIAGNEWLSENINTKWIPSKVSWLLSFLSIMVDAASSRWESEGRENLKVFYTRKIEYFHSIENRDLSLVD